MAQGMARATGKPAVCPRPAVPGDQPADGDADAKLDSIPIVAITRAGAEGDDRHRCLSEVDTYGLTIPITKHNFVVLGRGTAEVIPARLSPSPPPVAPARCWSISQDVQTQRIEVKEWLAPGSALEPAPLF